jgi:hypothetical protein
MNNDHDILIELKTILKGVVDDFRAYRTESHKSIELLHSKVTALEQAKVSIVEYSKMCDSTEERLSKVEKWQWMALGVIAILQFIAPFLINKLF